MGLRGRGTLRTANSRIVSDQATGERQVVNTPDFSEEYRNTEKRKQLMINAIEGLKSLGKGAINQFEKQVAEPAAAEAAARGSAEATAGKESTAGWSILTGNAQQDAYNKVTSRINASKLPDAYMANYQQRAQQASESGDKSFKTLDLMTPEERRQDYAKFKAEFVKEFDKQPFFAELSLTADSVMEKHLGTLDRQVNQYKKLQAFEAVGTEFANEVESFINSPDYSPEGLEEVLNARGIEWEAAAGSKLEANQAIMQVLTTRGAGLDDGKPKLAISRYLQSPEAKKRFGAMEGFDKVVRQVRESNIKYEQAELRQQQNEAEMLFYGSLSGGDFSSEKEIRNFLENTPLDEKKKFELMNKGIRHIGNVNGARTLEGAINTGQAEIVNAAKPEVLEQAFSMHVGSQETLDLAALQPTQAINLIQWMEKGFDVPKFVQKFGEATYDNGTEGMRKMSEQRNLYSMLRSSSGNLVSKIFPANVQAKLDLLTRIQNDSSMTDQERKNALNGFDAAWRRDSTGEAANVGIMKELKEKELNKDLVSFSKDNSLQPWFTFSDASESSQEWAQNEVGEMYRAYRLSGLPQKEAMERAQGDFVANNQWVSFDNGDEVYIPNSFGGDFNNKVKAYLTETNVVNSLALKYKVSPEEVLSKLTVRPEREYHISRNLEVVYDGVIEDYRFDANTFINNLPLIEAQELDRIVSETSKMFNDPVFIEQRKRIDKARKIRGDLGLLGR